MHKIKYITNKDLLAEIHRSKTSYCSFVGDQFADYDVIVGDVADITPDLIQRTRERKASLMMAAHRARQKEAGIKNHAINVPVVDPLSIPVESLVFRVMTWEHVPLDPDRKRRNRSTAQSHARTNFPPFKHYVVEKGEPREVGRSHWIGSLSNGEFSTSDGKMTPQLASMCMMLVERYSRRGNWRGYCVDHSTEALTKRGWLRHDQITEDDTILSYDLEEKRLKWSRIKSIYRGDYDGNMFKLTVNGMDALVTPGHRFVTTDGLKRVDYLESDDTVILMAEVSSELQSETGLVCDHLRAVKVASIDFHGAKRSGTLDDPNEPTVPYTGLVWCPETEYGSFMARRNEAIYLSSNTYVDEMRSHALLQLSQIALQFDETKSDNPFAFYTTAIKNSFTRILNLERKNQSIRDDMLIMHGVSPSYTRQIDNELDFKFEEQNAEKPKTGYARVSPNLGKY